MNAIIYLLVAVAVVVWIRRSLLSVPASVPAPRPRKMRGMAGRPPFAAPATRQADDGAARQ